jgi:HIRAN domain
VAAPRETFLRGSELVNVAGESHYQEALRAIAGTAPGPVRHEATAHLVPEPENAYDPNAVRVEIGGEKVGYVPRDLAAAYAPLLAPIVARGRVAACEALVAGREGPDPVLGVFLRLPPPSDETLREDLSRRF